MGSDPYLPRPVIRTILPNGLTVLVRPDRFVAWRSMTASNDPFTDLRTALARVLHRELEA